MLDRKQRKELIRLLAHLWHENKPVYISESECKPALDIDINTITEEMYKEIIFLNQDN
jgi:hypothetical protein